MKILAKFWFFRINKAVSIIQIKFEYSIPFLIPIIFLRIDFECNWTSRFSQLIWNPGTISVVNSDFKVLKIVFLKINNFTFPK